MRWWTVDAVAPAEVEDWLFTGLTGLAGLGALLVVAKALFGLQQIIENGLQRALTRALADVARLEKELDEERAHCDRQIDALRSQVVALERQLSRPPTARTRKDDDVR